MLQRKGCQLFITFYVMIWGNRPWFTCAIKDCKKGINEHFSIALLSKTSKVCQSLFPGCVLEEVGKNINWLVDYIDRSKAILNALIWLVNICSLRPVLKILSYAALSKMHNHEQEWRGAQSPVLWEEVQRGIEMKRQLFRFWTILYINVKLCRTQWESPFGVWDCKHCHQIFLCPVNPFGNSHVLKMRCLLEYLPQSEPRPRNNNDVDSKCSRK